MSITRFDTFTLKKVRAQMNEALELAGEELGVRFVVGNIRYSAESCNIKVEAYIEDAAAALKTSDKLVWDAHCRRYGFKPSDHGTVFVSPQTGESFKITTIKTRNRKYPIVGEKINRAGVPTGKTFKFTVDAVRRGLAEVK